MKHIAFTLTHKKEYKKAIKESTKEKYNSILIQVFTGQTNLKKIKKILSILNKDFSNAVIIGTTTAGEINHAKMYDNTTTISISYFTKTKLESSYAKSIDSKSGQKLANNICKN